MTHGLAAVRLALAGAPTGQVLASAGLEALVGACWFGIALLVFDRLTQRGRADGTIDLV